MSETTAAGPRREWVLVDDNEIVLAVSDTHAQAVAELNARFDVDPADAGRLRAAAFENGAHVFDEWPRSGGTAERAGALARELSRTDKGDHDDRLEHLVRSHFLRADEMGWTRLAGKKRRSLELWWYAPDGEHEPVGLLVERREVWAWQLLLDERGRGLTFEQLHVRIAEVMCDLGDTRWTDADIACVADAAGHGRAPFSAGMGPAALYVQALLMLGAELHVTEPLGQLWR